MKQILSGSFPSLYTYILNVYEYFCVPIAKMNSSGKKILFRHCLRITKYTKQTIDWNLHQHQQKQATN